MAKGNTPSPKGSANSGGTTSGGGGTGSAATFPSTAAQRRQMMNTLTQQSYMTSNAVTPNASTPANVLAARSAHQQAISNLQNAISNIPYAASQAQAQSDFNQAYQQYQKTQTAFQNALKAQPAAAPQQPAAQASAAPQQQAQAAPQQAQSTTTNGNYNYFSDTSKLPNRVANTSKDIDAVTSAFLSKGNLDKIASFVDGISDAEMNMPKQSSQWIVSERMGFNAKPKVHDHVKSLSQNEPDRVVMYRGIFGDGQQGAQWAEEYKTGNRFASKGVYGDGDYFQLSYSEAADYAAIPNAGAYSSSSGGVNANIKGSVVTASFNPSKARIIDASALKQISYNIISTLESKKNRTPAETKVLRLVRDNMVTNSKGKSQTFVSGRQGAYGTIATILGYDAIYKKNGGGQGNDYYAILNRGILDVKKGY